MKRKNLPSTWILSVTHRCNLRCDHCFYWKKLSNNESELSLEEIEKISLQMGRVNTLLISGGEPTLREDISDICHLFYMKNGTRNIHFPTNGLDSNNIRLQLRRIMKKCKDIKLKVGLPLEGLEKTNDLIRGVKGAFRNVIRTANCLQSLKEEYPGLSTYIITTVSNKNYHEIMQLAEFVNTLPVDGLGPSPLRGSPKNKDMRPPTSSQWTTLITKLTNSNYLVSKNFLYRNREVSLYRSQSRILDGEFVVPCIAGDMIGVLESSGDVRVCELTPVIGNVRESDYDLSKIWFSNTANKMREKLIGCQCTHACFLMPSKDARISTLVKSLVGI
ncbi:radical SAM protein [Candidatus Woesearchaeota archaeon]|nr:radical SAM protein [Candidatus Woesearchaeota archaeon]